MYLLAAGLAAPATAQDYPNQTIKLISSFGAGGGSDIIGRIIAQRLQEKLGQPVVVENRPGAGGLLGNEAVANAPKDGYTLGVQTAGQIITPVMTKVVRFEPVESFDWIGQIAVAGLLIVVRPDYPYKDIKSLVAAAKADPGKIVFGSPGFGATQHLAAELFKQVAGVNMLHVPYRSNPLVVTDLLGGQISLFFGDVSTSLPPVRAGKLKGFAVSSLKRSALAPDLPTLDEAGVKGFDMDSWAAFFLPANTPPEIVTRLNTELRKIIDDPEIKAQIAATGFEAFSSSPEELDAFVKAQLIKWTRMIKDAGIQPE